MAKEKKSLYKLIKKNKNKTVTDRGLRLTVVEKIPNKNYYSKIKSRK